MKFIYTDNNTKQIVFQCEAEGILEADKMYEQAIGKNPIKQPHVGCQIKPS